MVSDEEILLRYFSRKWEDKDELPKLLIGLTDLWGGDLTMIRNQLPAAYETYHSTLTGIRGDGCIGDPFEGRMNWAIIQRPQ